ncbi:cupin domain-containing protein [Nocardioidaceae bacterium]|nr:cupin domain-containing protein [Nocardioidaceae bacterium]
MTSTPRDPVDPLLRVSGMSTAEFASTTWSRRPLLRRAHELPGVGFADLLDLDAVDELVSMRGLRTPFARMAKDGQVLATTRFTGGGGAGAEIADQLADDKVLAEIGSGATLVLQGLHRVWPPVVDLAGGLARALGHPTQVNAYVTPAQSTGFAPHYDVHDVFVLQLAGRKSWRVHEPVLVDPLRDQPWDARADEVAARAAEEPLLDVTLEPGDALYLPRGYLHAATALGEVSAHLTVGVQAVTRATVASQVLDLLGEDRELRRSLPAGVDLGDPAAVADDLAATREALHAAVDRLEVSAVADALARHVASRVRPEPISPLAQLRAGTSVEAGTRVRVRAGLRWTAAAESDGRLAVRALGRTLRVPGAVEDGVRHLLGGDVLTPASVPGLDEADARVLVARLLREGLVVPAGHA